MSERAEAVKTTLQAQIKMLEDSLGSREHRVRDLFAANARLERENADLRWAEETARHELGKVLEENQRLREELERLPARAPAGRGSMSADPQAVTQEEALHSLIIFEEMYPGIAAQVRAYIDQLEAENGRLKEELDRVRGNLEAARSGRTI